MRRFIIYHNDADGICAAAIAGRAGLDAARVVYLPVDYGQAARALPLAKFQAGTDELWLLDFSFGPEEMLFLLARAGAQKFFWFDHHATALAALSQDIFQDLQGLRQDGTAACMLVWRFCHGNEQAPWPVELIADRDVWRFYYKETARYFYEALLAEPDMRPESMLWSMLLEIVLLEDLQPWLSAGCVLWRARRQSLKFWAEQLGVAVTLQLPGGGLVDALRVNYPGSGDMAEVIQALGYPVAWCYVDKPGGMRKHSLYSASVDVSGFCAARGGGGHKGAAGFIEYIDMPEDIDMPIAGCAP